jgi:uncharacterized radical SAM superfamily protein
MGRCVDCYYPGKEFPAVSTTGRACALNCKHCAGRYLESMIPITEPGELIAFAQGLADRGGEGMLLSGGSDSCGKVSLGRFAGAIREIRATTSLTMNAHVGLMPKDELSQLVDAGVDIFSADLYGDDMTVNEVLGLRAHASDYVQVVRDLNELGAQKVAPHVCVGILGGRLRGEIAAVRALEDMDPYAVVLLSLVPTRGTAYESVPAPGREELIAVITAARASLPDTRLLLGCMRSKRDRSWEADAIRAGLDGIVLPADATLKDLEATGFKTRSKNTCCAVL